MADDTPGDQAAKHLIYDAREQAAAAVRVYNQATTSGVGEVAPDVQRDMASAALDYYNALYEFRDDGALEEPWDERGIQWLEIAANQRVGTDKPLPRANGATEPAFVPKLMNVPASDILNAIRELNDVAKELGFSAPTRDKTPSDEGDLDDLRELLGRRGQDESLEALPDGGEE